MARNINLNSVAWCDLVFEGKNKNYGAYEMRQTASKRHLLAFLVMLSAVTALVFLPSLLENAGIGKSKIENISTTTVLSDFEFEDNTPPIEELAKPLLPPPLMDIRKALAHNPPVIVDDQTDTKGREMLSQDELNKDKTFLISNVTVLEGSTKGVDPGDLLGDVFGKPGGTGTAPAEPELIPDIQAQFLGGTGELMAFLQKSIRYPQIAIENSIEGRTVVRFVVSVNGNISDVKVLKSSDPSLDKEAIRVVKSMPKWIPGKKNGKNVASYFTLPVTFKLSK